MSERHSRNERNRNQGGRGHHRPIQGRDRHIYAPAGGTSKFVGLNPQLPTLDCGSSKNNKPVEFLRLLGEHCAVTLKASIAEAFLSIPPAFGITAPAPTYPDIDPDADLTHVDRANINVWLNEQKAWSNDELKLKNDKLTAFSIVYCQISQDSRSEIEDHAEWTENFATRNLIYLITRIRATHIAVQSGNILQDQERVRAKWFNMRMTSDQSSFGFRKEVEEYQLERVAVGLAILPDSELIIGILNRVDQARYGHIRRTLLENQRLNIGTFPTDPNTIWKEIKDSQAVRFNTSFPTYNENVFLSRTEEFESNHQQEKSKNGRGGYGRGRASQSGRGRGGRHHASNAGPTALPSAEKSSGTVTPAVTDSITPRTITCYNCGKKGHKKSECRSQKVYFSEDQNESAFLATVQDFDPRIGEHIEDHEDDNLVLMSSVSRMDNNLLLDTQASIHIIANPELVENITPSESIIRVQGITKDVTLVKLRGRLAKIGISVYHSPEVAANILSYSRLQDTHICTFDNNSFYARPRGNGPELKFTNINGHYTMDLTETVNIYSASLNKALTRYNKKQIEGARKAYDFMERLGFVSYKAAAEVIRRSSISQLGFTRADLVICQDIYGKSAAYQMGHGTQKSIAPGEDDPIPTHEAIDQELQIDSFLMFGQVFFISVSVIMGLIMTTHLGTSYNSSNGDKAKSRAGLCLLQHIEAYEAHGFRIKRVTSDGENVIKAVKHEVERMGVSMNILGHGSHSPHAESAIRHLKNKARSTVASLPYALPARWAAPLVAFVTHTINMIPRSSAPGHISAYTSFTGRIPNFHKHTPHAFGIAGFLQKANHHASNTAAPRQDYCIWLGTTRNLAGTHSCFNLATLRMMTGDIFTPAPLTPDAVTRINQLAQHTEPAVPTIAEPALFDPSPSYSLDPDRGVLNDFPDAPPVDEANLPTTSTEEPIPSEITQQSEPIETHTSEDVMYQVSHLTQTRESTATTTHPTTHSIYAALSISEATTTYGKDSVALAGRTELLNCINKQVWECIPTSHIPLKPIPSKLFLTPKHTAEGNFKLLKGRIVGGGHRQDVTQFQESEISSPTVALTSVMIAAATAAHYHHHVMTLDHTAAYLNAKMTGPIVDMMLSVEVTDMLCEIDPANKQYVRPNGKIYVRLKKALYGCVQSAVLWYKELKNTLNTMGFTENAYDICSFSRSRGTSTDRLLVYVDDLFITSDSEKELDKIDKTLREKYGGVTSQKGRVHDYLGIRWDFTSEGQVLMSMEGYVKDIFAKYQNTKPRRTPANDHLFIVSDVSPQLSKAKQEMFHSLIMTLHYLAKRVRPDLLTAVSWCSSRVLAPTEEDEGKLDRILGYLYATKERGTILRVGSNLQLRAYVDASYAVYPDAKSVSGVVIMLGDAVIYVKSSKQKIVTRSSTESELVAISDSLSQILWTREYMMAAGIDVGPAVLFQDNQSTIFLANKGRSTSERTRHIKIRYFFIHHYINTKEIILEYMPTTDMLADIMTKPLHGSLFEKLSAILSGSKYVDV